QILEDMSYFHFLSNQSLVFDLSGHSNFLFPEVRALGVQVIGYQGLQKLALQTHTQKMKEFQASLLRGR
ncbi:MAG: hypothetical protein AAF203_07055, partial [Pseudomonadota bacterium]